MPIPSSYYNRIILGGQPASDYASNFCLSPRILSIKDSFGSVKNIVSDCGHCIRCGQRHMDEWVSRMILHSYAGTDPITRIEFSSPWKYCYFVTLTYGSYNLFDFDKHPFKKDWESSFPVCDRNNFHNKPAWTPSILCIEHIQKYLKRLRALLPSSNSISFVYCGEYGHEFGRPHWHLIVWSFEPIDSDFFSLAWGYKVKSNSSTDFSSYRSNVHNDNVSFWSIGDVRVDDLCKNGTFSNVPIHGANKSASYAFRYVCKYLCKSEELPESTLKRFYQAFINLPLDSAPASALNVPEGIDFSNFQNRVFERSNKIYYHVDFASFKKICKPIFGFSLGNSIGKDYFFANRARFVAGNFALPQFQLKNLTFPRYYHFLLSLERCPIYFEKASIEGLSFVKSDYKVVRSYFSQLATDFVSSAGLSFYSIPKKDLEKALNTFTFNRANVAFPLESSLKSSVVSFDLTYVVLRTPDGVYRCNLDYKTGHFLFFRYDRSLREYELFFRMTVPDFCEHIISILDLEEKRINDTESSRLQQLSIFDALVNDPKTDEVRQTFISVHSSHQREYFNSHKDIF